MGLTLIDGCVADCAGHLGKFDSCLAEALWESTLDGTWEATGTTEFDGHYALVLFPEAGKTENSDGTAVTVPAGFYIVHAADSGRVSLWTYDTEAEARKEFDAADARYGAWLGDED